MTLTMCGNEDKGPVGHTLEERDNADPQEMPIRPKTEEKREKILLQGT